MQNPTGVAVPAASLHGADATYQYDMTVNENKLAAIIAELFSFKPNVYAVQLLKETINTRCGTSL